MSTQVVSLKAVLADGRPIEVDQSQQRMLRALNVSYGMLGVIYEVTLRVRPIMTFTAWHRALDIETFARLVEKIPGGNVGLKFFLMPYRNKAFADVRHYDRNNSVRISRQDTARDWGDSTAISGVYRSIGRFVPFAAIRYPLADTLSATTHGFMNSRKIARGNNVTGRRRNGHEAGRFLYSTWCFPACGFSLVAQAYARFCRGSFARTAYRCDMPAVGYRVAQDQSALLSPSYDEPMIALQTISTVRRGWDDFVLDLADFAEHWGGIPIFNQTVSTRPAYVPLSYGGRIESFRNIRRQLDPQARLLNPFLARHYK